MKDLINVLEKLSKIESKYRLIDASKEQFNVFSALYKEHDEVKLHSRFISVLLDPGGRHGKGNVFLTIFLDTIGIKDFDIDGVTVQPNERKKSEYENIDILIRNEKKKQAIIIENKINAPDSNHPDSGQLERYFDLIQKKGFKEENIWVVYLSKDRHEPSKESLGHYQVLEKINGSLIDYGNEIITWLDRCLEECIKEPLLRGCIIQYLNLVKHMTNKTDEQEQIELLKLIEENEDYIKAAKLLFDNYKYIKYSVINNFWSELENAIKDRYRIEPGCDNCSITRFDFPKEGNCENYKKEYGIKIVIKKDDLLIYICNETNLYWGVLNNDVSLEYKGKITEYKKENNGYFSISEDSLVYRYVSINEASDTDKISLSDFTEQTTFNLIRKENRTRIIDQIIREIFDEFLPEILKQ